MPNGDSGVRPTRGVRIKRQRRRVKPDFTSPETLQKTKERLYGQYSPEALKARVMPVKVFFYVFGITKEGRKTTLGPFMSAQEADQRLAAMDDGEIFELNTIDLNRATRIIKAELMRRGAPPDGALERHRHKL